jgi:hypothetical protein
VELFRAPIAFGERGSTSYDMEPDGRFPAVLASPEELAPDHLNVVLNLSDDLRRRTSARR